MRRRVLDVGCGVSLIVALLAAGLAVRSAWWAGDVVRVRASSGAWEVTALSHRGGLWIGGQGPVNVGPSAWPGPGREVWPPLWAWRVWPSAGWRRAGGAGWEVGISMPYPTLLALACVGPLAWVLAWWRGRRLRVGHCRACGYDLRGTAKGAACPECGAGA